MPGIMSQVYCHECEKILLLDKQIVLASHEDNENLFLERIKGDGSVNTVRGLLKFLNNHCNHDLEFDKETSDEQPVDWPIPRQNYESIFAKKLIKDED